MGKLIVRAKDDVPIIELVDLVKQFNQKIVLNNLNLKINKGEFITILGASGSGKTTALRLIGGFEWPTRGEIKFYGVDVKDLPAYKRPTNTIFQDYALFPHLNVDGNIKYGLKLIRIPKNNLDYFDLVIQKYEAKLKADHFNQVKINKFKIKIKNLENKKQKLLDKHNKEQKNQLKKLQLLQKEWAKKAKLKMTRLDKEQAEYEKILNKAKHKSPRYKKAQRFMDNSDFHYSYWETYVAQKSEIFARHNTTRPLRKIEVRKRVKDVIELVGLEGNENKAIDELSGGMKQRVALARAIVTKPQILLLDEPLSALDLKVRQKMQRELKAIQQELGITFIFVTHDQEEAMTISDRIAIMRDGKVEQFDKPQIIYEYPINSWVASFIGQSNIFEASVKGKNKITIFNQNLPADTYNFKNKQKIKIMLRPEDVTIVKNKGFVAGEIVDAIFQGTFWEYSIKSKESFWRARTTKPYNIGDKIMLKWTASDVHSMEL